MKSSRPMSMFTQGPQAAPVKNSTRTVRSVVARGPGAPGSARAGAGTIRTRLESSSMTSTEVALSLNIPLPPAGIPSPCVIPLKKPLVSVDAGSTFVKGAQKELAPSFPSRLRVDFERSDRRSRGYTRWWWGPGGPLSRRGCFAYRLLRETATRTAISAAMATTAPKPGDSSWDLGLVTSTWKVSVMLPPRESVTVTVTV